jgi:hypothetical protein
MLFLAVVGIDVGSVARTLCPHSSFQGISVPVKFAFSAGKHHLCSVALHPRALQGVLPMTIIAERGSRMQSLILVLHDHQRVRYTRMDRVRDQSRIRWLIFFSTLARA